MIGGSVADLGVGARSAAAAPFRLLQILEVDRGEGRRLTRRRSRSKFDEAKLQRFGQQAGSDVGKKFWGCPEYKVRYIELCFMKIYALKVLIVLVYIVFSKTK